MKGSDIMFYALGAMTLVSGLLAVTTRQLFRAAIYLLFALIGIAGIYLWMDYQFIAAVQVVVYVGGIVVLIIFSIFLTHQAGEKLPAQPVRRKIAAFLAAFCGFALVLLQLANYTFTETGEEAVAPTVSNIGQQMVNTKDGGYALPFEVVSILLLAAMIGCIVIAIRSKATEQPDTTLNEING